MINKHSPRGGLSRERKSSRVWVFPPARRAVRQRFLTGRPMQGILRLIKMAGSSKATERLDALAAKPLVCKVEARYSGSREAERSGWDKND